MCRLLGVKANQSCNIHDLLCDCEHPFAQYGVNNPDGWGIGWYENNLPAIFKEDKPAHKSIELPKYSRRASSNIFIAHVRKGSGTPVCIQNCHPFRYREWMFAHNGFVSVGAISMRLSKIHTDAITGDTDSEVLFHWILQNMEEVGDSVEGVKTALELVRHYRHTALNFLLSDGHRLYAYREADERQEYFSLFITEETNKDPNGMRRIIVCSERITADNWKEIPMGELLCMEDGMIVMRAGMR